MASLIDYFQSLNIRALSQRLDVMGRKVERLANEMSQLRDFVTAVQDETTRIGADVVEVAKKLQAAIDSGDPSALADLGTAVTALHNAGDSLHAMATGGTADPLPAPPADGGGDVPAPAAPA